MMHPWLAAALLAGSLAVPGTALGAEASDPAPEGEQTIRSAPDTASYRLFVPRGYAAMPAQQWPLLIFLHDRDEPGDDADRLAHAGPAAFLAAHRGLPLFVVSPRADGTGGAWDLGRLERLLTHLRSTYRIDPARIYLSGAGAGGRATWTWMMERPRLFAAGTPVGGHDVVTADEGLERICLLKDVPIRASAIETPLIAGEGILKAMSAQARCPGGTRPARLEVSNDKRLSVRKSAIYNRPDWWLWLLEQRRPTTE
ncbi:carboxylesterase family protein [Methylorubrum podarium]|jgi:predicted peptidase|uniref:carboxylesterase family protein n=1 Tax=Methylorubrum podarium TaxID=200476 RepID=UPI001EE22712|nr:hypothetical protein [Methylorubrum podarium]